MNSRSWIVNASLGIAATLSGLIAAEIYLRMNPPVAVYMATRNIVQHTHSQNSDNPKIGYLPKANLSKRFVNHEFNVLVSINSMSMRGREYAFQKTPGRFRIAVVGDSFVFGWGVENHEVFTSLLEADLPKSEVLNFGVSGYAAYQELERVKTQVLNFQPDVILFGLYGIPEAYEPEKKTQNTEPQVSLIRKLIIFLEKHSFLFTLIQEARGSIQVCRPSSPEEQGKNLQLEKGWGILDEFQELSISNNFVPIVFYIPLKPSVLPPQRPDPDMFRVRDYCASKKILFLDLTDALQKAFKQTGRSPYFRLDDHWNREGHRVAAAALAQFLKNNNLKESSLGSSVTAVSVKDPSEDPA